MAVAEYGGLSFKEQIEFFRQKDLVPTERWTDLWKAQHDRGFMVAGAAKRELLENFQAAIGKAISEGTTLAEFRKDFDGIVARHGWSYKGGRGWRTRVIYETNLRTSYQAGRLAQMRRVADRRPYWRYVHSDSVTHPRPLHVSWDGTVLRHDDPWWETHSPPNGWGCKCRVFSLGERDLERLGKDGPDTAPDDGTREWTDRATGEVHRVPNGIDPGWDYPPGRGWVEGLTPRELEADDLLPADAGGAARPTDALPRARPAPASRLLPAGLSEQEYADRFLAEFGVRAPARHTIFEDVTGEVLLISDALFLRRDGTLKSDKRGRGRYLLLSADTIRSPDEIWQAWENVGGKTTLRRRYVARWEIEGEEAPALSVFGWGRDGWTGVTAFSPESIRNIESRARRGKRVYRRPE